MTDRIYSITEIQTILNPIFARNGVKRAILFGSYGKRNMATYARINEYGFIEAPFRAVDHETCRVSDDITYMTADVEDQYVVGQAAEPVDENGCLTRERITCRHRDEIVEVPRNSVDYIDVSPRMMVSIATAMIPFLPNDVKEPGLEDDSPCQQHRSSLLHRQPH